MNFDFTLNKFDGLCEVISKSEYVPLTVGKHLLEPDLEKFIIIRHDVDNITDSVLKMARIENKKGLSSTYYFRSNVFNYPEILKTIEKLGHEVGYHYEVMDKAKGDYQKAIDIFKNELCEFRKNVNIKTICMHGNSLTSYNNRDLWKHYDFKEFGIIGEAYNSINFRNVSYYSDTGRRWDGMKYRVKDVVNETNSKSINFKHTDDLIALIEKVNINKLYILVHPARWNDFSFAWIEELIFQNTKNFGKLLIKYYRGIS